ncbi:hypothetical protein FRC17_002096 [Serendipita sp. 399]|nr:hypothetical protein FRC17_002096 [Serendipita sp. 399]
MSRRHLSLGVILLGICFLLSLLISISAPYVRVFDIVRTSFDQAGGVSVNIRNNTAAAIREAQSGNWNCVETGHAYRLDVGGQVVDKSWTRGLVIHPIATAAILVALVLSFFTNLTLMLVASLVAFLGAVLILIVFAIDIALYVRVKARMKNVGGRTMAGPAFWMTLVLLLLVSVAGVVIWFVRRRAKAKEEDGDEDVKAKKEEKKRKKKEKKEKKKAEEKTKRAKAKKEKEEHAEEVREEQRLKSKERPLEAKDGEGEEGHLEGKEAAPVVDTEERKKETWYSRLRGNRGTEAEEKKEKEKDIP